jgi:hypothetical protein
MSEKLVWSVELLKEYIEMNQEYMADPDYESTEEKYDYYNKLRSIFQGIDNRSMMIDLHEKSQSRIKELEEENKRLIKHIIEVHKKSISYGREGMDMFAHTGLRDEYNEIISAEATGRKKDLGNV